MPGDVREAIGHHGTDASVVVLGHLTIVIRETDASGSLQEDHVDEIRPPKRRVRIENAEGDELGMYYA